MIGIQTYGLARELTADFSGTIWTLHELGFQAIEPYILFQKNQLGIPKNMMSQGLLAQLKAQTDSYGMTIPSAHVGVGAGWATLPASVIIRNLRQISQRFGIRRFVFSGMFSSAAGAKHWGTLLGKVARELADDGCQILYHNHECEFQEITVDGRKMQALEYFFSVAGAEVLLQLDMGWARFAGDEVALARQYGQRIATLHCKDFQPEALSGRYTRQNLPAQQFAPIGEGVVNTAGVLAAAADFPHYDGVVLIDQDKWSGPMLEAAQRGLEHLRQMQVPQ